MACPLGFRVGILIRAWQRHTCYTFPEILLTLQWRIQDFAEGGTNYPKGANVLFCKIFVENCMKMKEFGPSGATPGSASALLISFFVLRLCVSLAVSLSVSVCVRLLIYLRSDWGGVRERDDSKGEWQCRCVRARPLCSNFLITARKWSLRRLCFYTCLSVILFRGGHVWQGGHACQGEYVAGGVHGRGGMHARGNMWQGVCMAGGVCVVGGCAWQGGMHATHTPPPTLRDTVGQCAGGTHPTGMHSCFKGFFKCKKSWVCPGPLADFPRFYSSLWEQNSCD